MIVEQGAFATLFDSLGTELVKLLGKQATEQWKKVGWQKAAAEYRNKMLFLYDTVRVLGKPEPMTLEGLFTDVVILDKPTAFHRFDISQLRADPELLKGEKRQRGLNVVKQIHNNRLFILGKPGAGKTTFLKYLTLQTIKGEIQKIPIFVSLKEWADSKLELMPFMVQQFEICNFPDAQAFIEHILRRGEALVLFDGLDEVQQDGEQRSQLVHVLRNFSKQYLSSQCVITCRIAATDYSFEQFTYVEVADFTKEQIETFVNNWFHNTPKMAENFLTEFDKEAHRGLRELGRIPLLLSLLCLNYEEIQTFPARRIELYEEAIDALLKKWDRLQKIKRDEGYRQLSLGRKRQLFAKVAYDTFSQDEYFIPQNQLIKHIVAFFKTLPPADEDDQDNGEQVLKAIEAQHGIFTERAYQVYSFSHTIFQEYFTAKYIIEEKQRVADLITQRFDDSRWREVFFLVVSALDNADFFFSHFWRVTYSFLRNDAETSRLIQWSNGKANSVETGYKIGAVRSFYLFLARDLASIPDPARDISFARALDLARLCGLDSELAYSLDISYARAIDLDAVLTHSDNLAPDLKIDFLLTITLQASLSFRNVRSNREVSSEKDNFKKYFSEVINQCNLFDESLSELLGDLTIPDHQKEWKVFTERLRSIMQQERNIGYEWNLNRRQIETLNKYLRANVLMVECLKLAAVSDRKAIEDSVLLPPVV